MIYCDVSYYQNQPSGGVYKAIDWERMMKQGATGVWIKASQGLWPDRQFITQLERRQANDVLSWCISLFQPVD